MFTDPSPKINDSDNNLLFKIAQMLSSGVTPPPGSVITSFNTRTGAVVLTQADVSAVAVGSFNTRIGAVTLTSGDITTALGFTPLSQAAGDARYVLKTGDTMTGALNIGTGSIAANGPALALTQTWNNAGVTFTGLSLNVTDTASTSGSFLFDVQKDALSKFHVTNAGTARFLRQDQTNTAFQLFLRKTGNSVSSTGAIASGGGIGTLFFSGFNGAANVQPSSIQAIAAEAFTGSVNGTRLDLFTTPIGTNTAIVALSLLDTGAAAFRDGTATLPGITFTSDTNTGIYRIGADNFGLSAGGVLTLAVATTGVNLTSGLAYQYNSVNVIRAQTALNNYFFGPSGNLTMTGASNTSVGASAFISATTGLNNSAFGFSALTANTTGANNTSIGFRSLLSNTTGNNNTAIGRDSLHDNVSGSNLTAVGYESLFSNTTGISNSAFGLTALKFNTSGSENAASGVAALLSNTTGNQNSAFGRSALGSNTTGNNNTAVGYLALQSNTIGDDNTAIGRDALFFNVSGLKNTGLGFDALQNNTTGNNNTSSGYQSLNANTSGNNNAANGAFALFVATTGGNNSAFGGSSLLNLTTGSSNVAVGYNTGLGITTGINNTIIGANVTGLAAGLSNTIILADGAGNQRLVIDSTGNAVLAGTAATADGTAALPAHTFSADLDTGIYRIGANSFGLSTNGVLRVTTNTTDLILATAFRLAMASGANQRAGNAVLMGGTVTVANTSVTANTIILLTRKTAGGTIGFAVTYTVIAATSFTITSDNILDTSTYSYLLMEVP